MFLCVRVPEVGPGGSGYTTMDEIFIDLSLFVPLPLFLPYDFFFFSLFLSVSCERESGLFFLSLSAQLFRKK